MKAALMGLEDKLAGWIGPSSATEQDKQDRTERMVKEAISAWSGLATANLSVYAKGSYPNNTNVRTDSDVDIAVQCHDVQYREEANPGTHTPGGPYADLAVFFDRIEQPEVAAALYGASNHHHSSRPLLSRLRTVEDHLREMLGNSAFNEHAAAGAALELADAVRYARDQIHLARRRARKLA